MIHPLWNRCSLPSARLAKKRRKIIERRPCVGLLRIRTIALGEPQCERLDELNPRPQNARFTISAIDQRPVRSPDSLRLCFDDALKWLSYLSERAGKAIGIK